MARPGFDFDSGYYGGGGGGGIGLDEVGDATVLTACMCRTTTV